MLQTTKYERLANHEPITTPNGSNAKFKQSAIGTDGWDKPQVMSRQAPFTSEIASAARRQAFELVSNVKDPASIVAELDALAKTNTVCAVRQVLEALEVRHGKPYCINLGQNVLLGKNRFLRFTGEGHNGALNWTRLRSEHFSAPSTRSSAFCPTVVAELSKVIEQGIESAAKPLGIDVAKERLAHSWAPKFVDCDVETACAIACCFPCIGIGKAVELGVRFSNNA